MTEEFREIRQAREEHARKLRLKRQERDLALSRSRLCDKEKTEEKARFDGVVRELLEQLRLAAYPSLEISNQKRKWSLGMWKKQSDGSLGWLSVIDICLNYDIDNRAMNFECSRYQKKVSANLSRQGLIDALKQMFPPQKN
jgi:hypothetical protein